MLSSKEEAYSLLESLGAPRRLIIHLRLVGEAAEEVIAGLRALGVEFNEELVRLGAAIHDAGKIVHPNELDGSGNEHESAGEKLLLDNGVQAEVARCCLSHARFEVMAVTFEELLVALSDKLWKGKRVEALELRVIDTAAELLDKERWEVFSVLDGCFEGVASKGDARLARSTGS